MPIRVTKPRNWPYILFGLAVIPNILYLGHLLTPTAPVVPYELRWFLGALLAAGFGALFAALFTDPRLWKDVPPVAVAPAHPAVRIANPPRPRHREEQTEPTARIVVVARTAPSPVYRSAWAQGIQLRPDPRQITADGRDELAGLLDDELFQAQLDSEVRGYQMGRFDRDDTGDIESPKKDD